MESRLPPHISLNLAGIFGLVWDDKIIEQLVQASNAYGHPKKATKRQWL